MKSKRVLAIMVLLLMIVTNASAIDQPDTITFRDIPWLSSPQDFFTALQTAGFSTVNTVSFYEDARWESAETIRPEWSYRPVPQFCVTFENIDEAPIGTVAGYQVRTITAYFLAGYDLSSKKYYSGNSDSHLVSATYWIHGGETENKVKSSEAVYDLTNKLSKLYGEYKEINDNPYFSNIKNRVWRASDNSVAVLRFDTLESSFLPYNWFITIAYRKCDEQYAKELYECTLNETIDDTDGL